MHKFFFSLSLVLASACTTKGELGTANFNVGSYWDSGDIAQGSTFAAEAKLPFFGGKLRVQSSNEEVLAAYNGGFLAAQPGYADLQAIDELEGVVDFLQFEVSRPEAIGLRSADQELPDHFAMLEGTQVQFQFELLDDTGTELYHNNLVEFQETGSAAYVQFNGNNVSVRTNYGEQELRFSAGELEAKYRINTIRPTQMASFSIQLNGSQSMHPSSHTPADYGYEWVEVIVEAESADGWPVLIPSERIYAHEAGETWSSQGGLNRLWVEVRWGEFPIISLTPPAPEEPVYEEVDEESAE